MSRRSFVHHFPRGAKTLANAYFDQLVGEGKDHLPAAVPLGDLDALKNITKRTQAIVNKHIAHLDLRNYRRREPSVTEVHQCLRSMEAIYLKYRQLLTGMDLKSLVPPKNEDWMTVFDTPWRAANQAL